LRCAVKVLNNQGLDHILGQSAESLGLFNMLMMVPLAMLMLVPLAMVPLTAPLAIMIPVWARAVASVIPAAALVACADFV